MKVSKELLAVLVVLGCVFAVVLFKVFVPVLHPAPSDGAQRIKGAPNASVRIIEYSDYQCPACAGASKIIDDAITRYPGRISLEHRHLPLPQHPYAFRAAVYAECAGVQNKFWAYHDTLFRSQGTWEKMAHVDLYFKDLAAGLGLDGAALEVCVASDAIKNKIKADVAVARSKGIDATPTFFIGNKRIVGGGNLLRELKILLK